MEEDFRYFGLVWLNKVTKLNGRFSPVKGHGDVSFEQNWRKDKLTVGGVKFLK